MKPLLIIGAASIVLVSVLCAAVNYYHDKSERLVSEVKLQEKTLAQQSGLISALQAQDRKNRVLAAEQQQREQQLRQQYDILQRNFREAIKDNPCAAERMPDAVVELLQQNSTSGARAVNKPTP